MTCIESQHLLRVLCFQQLWNSGSVTVLHCYIVTVLHCYSVTLLQCYIVTLLQCYIVTMYGWFSCKNHIPASQNGYTTFL